MNSEKSRKRPNNDLKSKTTSIGYLKALSYPKAMALLPSERLLPRSIYGLDEKRTILPPDMREKVNEIARRGKCHPYEVGELALMLMLLTDEFYRSIWLASTTKGAFVTP